MINNVNNSSRSSSSYVVVATAAMTSASSIAFYIVINGYRLSDLLVLFFDDFLQVVDGDASCLGAGTVSTEGQSLL